jgi:hypothetical protein
MYSIQFKKKNKTCIYSPVITYYGTVVSYTDLQYKILRLAAT